MWSTLIFGGVLCGASLGLLAWHWLQRGDGAAADDERTRDFLHRQLRRRLQTSAMLGVVGLLSLLSLATPPGLASVLLWLVVGLLTLWIMLLAWADAVASQLHYDTLRTTALAEHARLLMEKDRLSDELARYEKSTRNGHEPSPDDAP